MKVYDLDAIIRSIGYDPSTRKYWVEKTLKDGFILSHESIYRQNVIDNISKKIFASLQDYQQKKEEKECQSSTTLRVLKVLENLH